MEILNVVFLSIVATILSQIVKTYRPEFSIQISIVTGIIIFIMIMPKIYTSMNMMLDYFNRANIEIMYFRTLIKIIIIAYIAEFSIELCNDANHSAIATKIDFAAKSIIVVLAIPIITTLLDLILDIAPK